MASEAAAAGLVRLDYPAAELVITASGDWRGYRSRPVAKEPWTVDWLERMTPEQDNLLDVGACVGSYSLIAASRGVAVTAVEPSYANYAMLCQNAALNGLSEAILPICAALGERSGWSWFSYSSAAPGAASHRLGDIGDDPPTNAVRQPILVLSLDDLFERHGLPIPSHLKLDVDGHEMEVLRGAQRLLRHEHLAGLLIEVPYANSSALLELLGAAGWSLARRWDARNGQLIHGIWYAELARA